MLEVKHTGSRVPAVYSRIARGYELWARLTESRARTRVLELAAVRNGEDVLDVATGTGVQLVALARRNPSGRTVGVELAEGMVRQTRRRLAATGLRRVELHHADARALPFPDVSFDLLTNGYMLDLLPTADIATALREFRRVLRPGGRLVLSNMTPARSPRTASGTPSTRAASSSPPTAAASSPRPYCWTSASPKSSANTSPN
jgi:ubiquinone/menaquinone biosynthesis C-methylase UbiE